MSFVAASFAMCAEFRTIMDPALAAVCRSFKIDAKARLLFRKCLSDLNWFRFKQHLQILRKAAKLPEKRANVLT